MAATAEKAELIDELRRTNASLVEANAELERQYVAVIDARRVKDELVDALLEFTALRRGTLEVDDRRSSIRACRCARRCGSTKGLPAGVQLIVGGAGRSRCRRSAPTAGRSPASSRALLSNAFKFTATG